ncbi:Xaa-Pro aminopeptidase [hydrothermal vent metagenome]|uniref:Xaa-Pro aminopeptidase n=1 Tax=hydrothermal vent metagenome TaxID=652676 RepID=A0A1W1CMG0_9ZZZZ
MKQRYIEKKQFRNRRLILQKKLNKNEALIIHSGIEYPRNNDVNHIFRVDSNFLYLTGINLPNITCFLSMKQFIIFIPKYDKNKEIWDGKQCNSDEILNIYGADRVFFNDKLTNKIITLSKNIQTIYYSINKYLEINKTIINLKKTIISTNKILSEMRLIKNSNEISLMQYAANISIKAHEEAMKQVKNCQYEHQIAAIFDYHFSYNNAQAAYPHIVAGGKNACTLHYINNNQPLKQNDLLLIDAGCEVECYASDITRTFPINGKFSPAQKSIYNIVLEAQKQAINCIKPDISIKKPHQIVVKIITTGLIKLGLLQGDIEENIKNKTYQQFFMHGTGHYLGLDVHDVGEYEVNKKPRKFQTGMVITVEPGIYIKPNDNIDKKWWNIGIRIEDDILITKNGHQNLTKNLVKEIADIEALMKE